jgi:hypothetical protein
MPQPTLTDVHVDSLLTNISIAYIQAQSRYIASRVFPILPVAKKTDLFKTYTKADWFRDEAKPRADSSESAGSGYNLASDSYSCDVVALHKDIGDQTRTNADSVINLDRDATEFVTQRLLLQQEKKWVSDYFATSIWDTDVVGNTDFTRWSTFATSDPVADIETAKETILINTGIMPNVLVIGYQVFKILKQHPQIIDRIKYTTSENVTVQLLARMFEVDRVEVAMATNNTAQEGATASYSFTHGKHALLLYSNPSPGLLAPSAGYTFQWTGISGGLGANVGIRRFRMELLAAERIEGQVAYDNKKVAADLGYFLSGAVV